MKVEIFSLQSKEKWEKVLTTFPDERTDIYYTPEYYQTWLEHEDGEAFCFFFEEDEYRLLYPFFRKEIFEFELNETYYDIFNAYGYGGVLSNSNSIPEVILKSFNEEFNKWCRENNIVAEFIRENPLFNSFIREAKYDKVRRNVYIKLNESEYILPSRTARQNVNKAIKSGLKPVIDKELKSMPDFIRLYTKTAMRLGMDKYYHFGELYFNNIKNYLGKDTTLINIEFDNKIIASTIFFKYQKTGNCHLAASDFDYKQFRMNDLMFNTAIDFANQLGCNTLCIGGGTSTDPRDSLFKFKEKFGNLPLDVYVGKKVINEEIYEELVKKWEEKNFEIKDDYKNYFLKYRIRK